MLFSHIIRNCQWLDERGGERDNEWWSPLPRNFGAHMAGHFTAVRVEKEYDKRGQTEVACSEVQLSSHPFRAWGSI